MERFEDVLYSPENQPLLDQYNAHCHFPFIGLVKEHGQSSFDGAATLARPPPLQINLSKHSPQSLKAVLKKYYTSLLYKLTCQVSSKKTTFDRFSLIMELMTDERELSHVLDLYEIKLTNQGDIEDVRKET